MPEFDICTNCLESAQQFTEQQDTRKAPNKRVGATSFWGIAIKGAHTLDEQNSES